MRIKSSSRVHKDFYEYFGKNMLYDFVKMYGAYIDYYENGDEGAFNAYYNNKKDVVLFRYINLAHRDIKKYLFRKKIIISSRKLNYILETKENDFIRSYSWMPLYIEYFLNKIFNNNVMRDYAMQYIIPDCIYRKECEDIENPNIVLEKCRKSVMGFQFDFLNLISVQGTEKQRRVAKDIINNVYQIKELSELKRMCRGVII